MHTFKTGLIERDDGDVGYYIGAVDPSYFDRIAAEERVARGEDPVEVGCVRYEAGRWILTITAHRESVTPTETIPPPEA